LERTIRSLHKVSYPVWKVDQEPLTVDGLTFVGGNIVDDKNISAPTLGARRLLSPHPMHRLSRHRGDVIELIKDTASTKSWYIDNLGSVFNYRRTSMQELVCHKIDNIIYKDFYSLIILEGINFPVLVSRPPVGSFAQMLYYKSLPWKLYNIMYEWEKPTRKKV
jgi:hypothetical protein